MSPGPRFKKIRKSQGNGRLGVSTKGASKGSTPLFSTPNSTRGPTRNGNRSSNGYSSSSATHSAHQKDSNSGSGFRSGPTSPMAEFLATNDNFGHGRSSSPTPGSTPDSDASRSNAKRNGRGATRGLNLDKIVEKYGKINIKFNHLMRRPARNEKEFSQGIGIAVRTCAELEGVTMWREISQANKDMCYKRLLQWFEIEDWETLHVQKIVYQAFQVSYKNWRNHLANIYRELVEEGHDPRDRCPRAELKMEEWLAICDWVECDDFQSKSLINSENRKKLQYSHTSGRTSFRSRYEQMKEKFEKKLTTLEPSKIQLWRRNHVDKTGKFVSPVAEEIYAKMVELEKASTQEGGTPLSEDQILEAALGHRSGYQKGMGSGVLIPRDMRFSSSSQQNSELKDKLNGTQSELESAKGKIDYLATELDEQKEKNISCEKKIEELQKALAEMQKFMMRM